MITGDQFRAMALSFANTEEVPHFERIGFKIIGRRMFATYLEKENTANIFLTPAEQDTFCKIDQQNIAPVPNKWGEKGATTFHLNKVARELVQEALLSAYNQVLKSNSSRERKRTSK